MGLTRAQKAKREIILWETYHYIKEERQKESQRPPFLFLFLTRKSKHFSSIFFSCRFDIGLEYKATMILMSFYQYFAIK